MRELKSNLRKTYLGNDNWKTHLRAILLDGDDIYIYRFLYNLRRYEYSIKKKTSLLTKIERIWYLRKYQKYARILGYVIGDGVLGEDVILYHRASIIINPDARVGDGCKFHGDCCIGVLRTNETGCPVIGNNVDIGAGVKILGDIYIADNIVIGANSVVTKTFDEAGITIAGIPARRISK